MKNMDKTTIKEQFLTNKAYGILKYVLLIATCVILLLPWLHLRQANSWIIGLYFLALSDLICTFLQKRAMNVYLSLILGVGISAIAGIILLFYNALI